MAANVRRSSFRRCVTRRPARLAAMLVPGPLLLAAGVAGADAPMPDGPAAGPVAHVARSGGAAKGAMVTPPLRKPPASICGSHGLRGPTRPPKGAKVVRNQNLASVAANSRPGTVFWISPGKHTLGRGLVRPGAPQGRSGLHRRPGRRHRRAAPQPVRLRRPRQARHRQPPDDPRLRRFRRQQQRRSRQPRRGAGMARRPQHRPPRRGRRRLHRQPQPRGLATA